MDHLFSIKPSIDGDREVSAGRATCTTEAPLHQRWPSGRLSLLERQARPALRLDDRHCHCHRNQAVTVQQPDEAQPVDAGEGAVRHRVSPVRSTQQQSQRMRL